MTQYKQKHKNTGYEVKGQELAEQDAVAQEKKRAESEPHPSDYTEDLLDEIDSLLEEDEEFAAKFIQKGGQ